jgi:hypothetical protein
MRVYHVHQCTLMYVNVNVMYIYIYICWTKTEKQVNLEVVKDVIYIDIQYMTTKEKGANAIPTAS